VPVTGTNYERAESNPSIEIEFHVTFVSNFISKLTYSIQILS